ncbi:uncharacterized protein LOC113792984 [Dermatophagoides pteronyssinus]|uniref:uncharacterized protein LOC113792984 n=1 Tax=Dermatophagoides pteronyssinus TaxID=6956 RepID=UPI003F661C2B
MLIMCRGITIVMFHLLADLANKEMLILHQGITLMIKTKEHHLLADLANRETLIQYQEITTILKVVISVIAVIGLVNIFGSHNDGYDPELGKLELEINRKMFGVIRKLHDELYEVRSELEAERVMTMLSIKFSESEKLIHQIFDSENPRFANALELLFPGITMGQNTPKKYWHMENCLIKQKGMKTKLIIKVNGIRTDQDYTLLRADPFYLAVIEPKNLTGHEEICLTKYNGPQYVVYQEKTGCSAEIVFDPIEEHQTPFVFHSPACRHAMKSVVNQWKKSKCMPQDKIIPEEIVQVKMDNDFVYYYCYTQNTTIMGNEERCANKIYKIKKGKNVTINHQVIKFHKVRMELFTNIDTDLTDAVNNKIFRQDDAEIALNHLEKMIQQEDQLVVKITSSYLRYYLLWTAAIVASVALLIALCYIFYQWKKSVRYRTMRRERLENALRSEMIRMTQA